MACVDETKNFRKMALEAKESYVFEELFYCDGCAKVIAIKLPGLKPMACVFRGWFVEKGVKGIDYCRECLVRWLEDQGIEPPDSPYSFQGRSLVIHDLDDPRGSCVFCKDMDSLQWCSICCENPYARFSPANPAFDDLSSYYFDDRVGRVVPTFEDEARTVLIEESLAKGDLEGVTALLVEDPSNNDPSKTQPPPRNKDGTDLPICKDCWYIKR